MGIVVGTRATTFSSLVSQLNFSGNESVDLDTIQGNKINEIEGKIETLQKLETRQLNAALGTNYPENGGFEKAYQELYKRYIAAIDKVQNFSGQALRAALNEEGGALYDANIGYRLKNPVFGAPRALSRNRIYNKGTDEEREKMEKKMEEMIGKIDEETTNEIINKFDYFIMHKDFDDNILVTAIKQKKEDQTVKVDEIAFYIKHNSMTKFNSSLNRTIKPDLSKISKAATTIKQQIHASAAFYFKQIYSSSSNITSEVTTSQEPINNGVRITVNYNWTKTDYEDSENKDKEKQLKILWNKFRKSIYLLLPGANRTCLRAIREIVNKVQATDPTAILFGDSQTAIIGLVGEIQALYVASQIFQGIDSEVKITWLANMLTDNSKKFTTDIQLFKEAANVLNIQVKNSIQIENPYDKISFSKLILQGFLDKIGLNQQPLRSEIEKAFTYLSFNRESHKYYNQSAQRSYEIYKNAHNNLLDIINKICDYLSTFVVQSMSLQVAEEWNNNNLIFFFGNSIPVTASQILQNLLDNVGKLTYPSMVKYSLRTEDSTPTYEKFWDNHIIHFFSTDGNAHVNKTEVEVTNTHLTAYYNFSGVISSLIGRYANKT